MLENIEAKNVAWMTAVANECGAMVGTSVDGMSVKEQLITIFDSDFGEEHDEAFRRRLVSENDLYITIEKGEIPHLSPTMRDALKLCEEILRLLPQNMSNEFNPKFIKKKTYGFAQRGEQAVFGTFSNTNVTFVDLYVRTEAEACEDFLYWSKNKLFLMHFVDEFDEECTISTNGFVTIN